MSISKTCLKPTWNSVLLTIYLLFLGGSYLFLYVTDDTLRFALLFLGMAAVFYVLSSVILAKMKTWRLQENKDVTFRKKLIVFGVTFLISFAYLFLWYLGYYPGGYSPDSAVQLEQATGGHYLDWHPVWHTILFYGLPMKLAGNTAFLVVFQMIIFSLTLSYAGMVVYQFAGKGAYLFSVAYILLNPYTGSILVFTWKDVAFAIAALLGTAQMLEVWGKNGVWERKWWRCVLLGITMANATLLRHNGVLFAAVALFALFFTMKKKQWLQVFAAFALFLIVVRGPLYHALAVEKPGDRVSETMGMPLTIMGNVAKEFPESMDEEMSEMILGIAPLDLWRSTYEPGNFNSIKYAGVNLGLVNDAGIPKVLRVTGKCFVRAPKASIRAFIALTDMVYGIENSLEGDVDPEMYSIPYGVPYTGNEKIAGFLKAYKAMVNNSFLRYFRGIGFTMVVMLVCMLAKCDLKKWKDWKKLFFCLPVFAYNFGTMLLLTGPDSRFFYVSYVVCPLVVCLAMRERSKEECLEK